MGRDADQMALDQIRLARRRHADRDIGLPHRQVELGIVDHEGDLDLGIEVEELADARGQPSRAERHRRGDLERPLRPVLRFGDQAFGHRQLGEHLARRAEQQLALLGQDQAAGMAVKQRHAEAFLERADLPADGGLAEVQRFAGMGEAARLGDGVKHPQLVPIHPVSPGNDCPASIARLLFGRAHRRSFLLRREKLLGLERRHAAQSGGGHRLAEDLVLDVARGKDAGDRGRGRIGRGDDIALGVERRAGRRRTRSPAYGRSRRRRRRRAARTARRCACCAGAPR